MEGVAVSAGARVWSRWPPLVPKHARVSLKAVGVCGRVGLGCSQSTSESWEELIGRGWGREAGAGLGWVVSGARLGWIGLVWELCFPPALFFSIKPLQRPRHNGSYVLVCMKVCAMLLCRSKPHVYL